MTHHETSHTSVRAYLLVFLGLGLLTGLTVLLSYAGLSHQVAIVVAALISLVKCSLIAVFFMHLRFEGKTIYAVFFTAFILLGVLFMAIMPEIGINK